MTHTEAFNRIMAGVPKKERKKKQPPIQFEFIKPRENMNELQKSLSICTLAGNVLHLPKERIDNYNDVRKALLNAGASYVRNTFVFPNDAKQYVDRLMDGDSVNIKKEFQFFATPKELAQEMVAFAMTGFDSEKMIILEPSAGQGAIVKEILEWDDRDKIMVHAFELMNINRNELSKIRGCIILGEDFLAWDNKHMQFDRIVANPPFSKNQDIDHIKRMYEVLRPGGRIVTIASNSWRTGSQKKQLAFKEWLDELGATVDDVEAGAFKESGTNIATCMIIIDK